MKANEFKKYQNYALHIKLHDLDHDFSDDGISWQDGKNGAKYGTYYTEEELAPLWKKEVISFDMTAGDAVWECGGEKTLHLYVSNLTQEERQRRQNEYEIKNKIDEIKRLTGKNVILEE